MTTKRPIKFGLNATNMHTTWPEYQKLCREAEAMGFDSFWVFDHFVPGPVSHEGDCLEVFTTISALASITSRITLGTLVLVVTHRHPALTAKMAAMVDHISNGRLIFGYGPGYDKGEHAMFGLELPPAGERLRREDEALTLMKRLWAEEQVEFDGRYYFSHGGMINPKPVQQPHPPILIGARGDQAMTVVAKHANLWNSAAGVDDLAVMTKRLDEKCAAIGRDPAEIERTAIALHAFAATPARTAAKEQALSKVFNRPFEEIAPRVLSGAPEQVIEQLQRYVDIGITHFMISQFAPYDLDGLKLMADKIIPHFK